jgi:outer membrane receptor protein involved in Fe transport
MKITKRKHSHLKRSGAASRAIASAIAVMAPAFAITGIVAPLSANAQDYTTGALSGSLRNETGASISGADVSVTSLAQGFTRSATTDSNGTFRVGALPAGDYQVVITLPEGGSVEDTVRIQVGSDTAYGFRAESSRTLDRVVVKGTASKELAFSQTTSGVTVDVRETLRTQPLGRSIEAVTLLAPTTVQADSNFSIGAPTRNTNVTVGGSSPAENAFYVNGLNITNFDTYLGSAPVPFDFFQSVEVKTGGYPAEFGRATGGVVNAVTRSGTNEWEFGVSGDWAPDALRSTAPNTYRAYNELDERDSSSLTFTAGGPVVKDRLFIFGLYQLQDSRALNPAISTGSAVLDESDDPFFGLKVDGYVTDTQRVELTYFDTSREVLRTSLDFDPATEVIGAPLGKTTLRDGGESWVSRYTGQFTDWLTLSAAYGVSNDRNHQEASDPDTPYIVDARSGTALRIGPQTSYSNDIGETQREFYRFDADVSFDLLGKHQLRVGLDNEKTTLDHVAERTGGADYRLFTVTTADSAEDYGVPIGTELVRTSVVRSGGMVEGENQAFYIQDSWDVTDRLNLQLGLRNDYFKLGNLIGETALDLKDNWGPRAGFNYDVDGTGNTRIYGSYGRYFIPPASNLSYRSADLFVREYFHLVSVDAANGSVVLGDELTSENSNVVAGLDASACPAGAFGAQGTVACLVYGNGVQEAAISKTSKELKATYEDEFVLGVDHILNKDWSLGARFTYRNLGDVSEDIAIDYAILAYCDRNGISGCEQTWFGDYQYVVLNPGHDITVYTRDPLPGDTELSLIKLTAADLKVPEAEREYVALELNASRQFDGVWSLDGSYVWSSSYGNYEGTVLSDIGQDDAGATILYDHPGLTDNQYGYLPNHRRHQFKVRGSYQVTDSLMVGANLTVASPRKYGCLGVHPTDASSAAYGADSRYCQGVGVRRGTSFESDWLTNVDLAVRYDVPLDVPGGLTLRADIFNVFDFANVVTANETGDLPTGGVDPNYMKPETYQSPRIVRIGFDWTF